MLPEYFVVIGVIITAIGGISYLIDTIRAKVQPNRITWLLWALAPMIAFFAQRDQGVGIQALLTFVIGFIPALIFVASFINKKSKWKIVRFDLICGALSILGLVLWLITRVGNIAILFSIMADLLAAVPTYKKSYTDPESESFKAFFLNVIGAGLIVLAIKDWSFANAAFSIYFLLSSILITFLIGSKIGAKSSR
jgi:hypothetical protein